ncbi:MAG: hydrogenase maturation protease [Thiotrichaceae bacterium]|nr:hydrogenase maturation protease [Thiotrichaceae bacterium]
MVDDQFGWLVIEQLQTALKERADIRTICCDHSGVDWIHQYQAVDHLIFVDAVKSDAEPGTLHQLTIKPTELNTLPTTHSSHGIGLRKGIALAAAVVELPAE